MYTNYRYFIKTLMCTNKYIFSLVALLSFSLAGMDHDQKNSMIATRFEQPFCFTNQNIRTAEMVLGISGGTSLQKLTVVNDALGRRSKADRDFFLAEKAANFLINARLFMSQYYAVASDLYDSAKDSLVDLSDDSFVKKFLLADRSQKHVLLDGEFNAEYVNGISFLFLNANKEFFGASKEKFFLNPKEWFLAVFNEKISQNIIRKIQELYVVDKTKLEKIKSKTEWLFEPWWVPLELKNRYYEALGESFPDYHQDVLERNLYCAAVEKKFPPALARILIEKPIHQHFQEALECIESVETIQEWDAFRESSLQKQYLLPIIIFRDECRQSLLHRIYKTYRRIVDSAPEQIATEKKEKVRQATEWIFEPSWVPLYSKVAYYQTLEEALPQRVVLQLNEEFSQSLKPENPVESPQEKENIPKLIPEVGMLKSDEFKNALGIAKKTPNWMSIAAEARVDTSGAEQLD